MPRPAYLKRSLLVQRVSFTPGSQVLSAGSSERCHCKTKDSSNWHDNGTISRHFKSSRHCTADAPSLPLPGMFTHTFQQLTPQQRPGSFVKGTALRVGKDSVLPLKPGENFSLNTIYSIQCSQKTGSQYSTRVRTLLAGVRRWRGGWSLVSGVASSAHN